MECKQLFLAKWDYYGNLQWVVDTESSGTGQYADIKRPGGTSDLYSAMDLDKSTGDVAIIALGLSSNDDLKFGGVSIGPFGTCLNDRQPWIAKVNTNGQVQWTEVGTADPINCGHVYQQQVVLHHDGSVTAAGKSTGSGGYNFGPILPPQAVSPHLGLRMLIVRELGMGRECHYQNVCWFNTNSPALVYYG